MKQFCVLLTAISFFLSGKLNAQSAEDSVKAVINQLFQGMKQSDGAMIASSFGDSALLQTITRAPGGGSLVRNESVKDFASSISQLEKGAADEQIVFKSILIDGALASVWTPYKFYFKGQFSHCGVNSFQVVRINGEWKIQYIIDTRRRQPCD